MLFVQKKKKINMINSFILTEYTGSYLYRVNCVQINYIKSPDD